ncbi:YicC family protein [Ammoniphilus oxalaticus]|uniref:YicC family protein n=1 Tax=Ammoniphilus oxalaticus TaxID=66863 RepID=A0A419SJL5_9BACL|nr:YicC/YloC family endoribonuclease [Ammoniphilus oxalaticus]RKD24136.1 YicC family protein [Ammoniphilus oxalaticus]
MIKSMTGYGQAVVETDEARLMVEMRSVNHRFLDISARMPRDWTAMEELVKKQVGRYVKRGKVDLFVSFETTVSRGNQVSVDWTLADEYARVHQLFVERYQLAECQLTALEMMNLPEVISVEESKDEAELVQKMLIEAVDYACQSFLHMRQSEGNYLREELTKRIRLVMRFVDNIKERGPLVAASYQERLGRRMEELLAGRWEADEGKILTEVASFAERADVDEEITRLHSHCKQFLSALEATDSVGRKLDFLVQEMNREVNTIGSKAHDLQISQKVVELKAELEKMREQVQNIE